MEQGTLFSIDRSSYTKRMAQNLPVLRSSLGVSQANLAEIIGVTRQTLSAAEAGTRELSWGNFISLLFVFTQNEQTLPLLRSLGIYTEELDSMFHITNLKSLREQSSSPKKARERETK